MSDSPWREVVVNREIPAAAADGFWTPVLDYVPAGTILKIQARGRWNYSDESAALVGPAGDPASPVARDQLLNAKACIGALVGKIGGSTGEKEGDHSFVVGSYCVLEVPEKKAGALMLAMNNLGTARVGSSEPLLVSIHRYQTAPAPNPQIVIPEAPTEIG
jgi:hypothetical protein